jgi:hypothetical protein
VVGKWSTANNGQTAVFRTDGTFTLTTTDGQKDGSYRVVDDVIELTAPDGNAAGRWGIRRASPFELIINGLDGITLTTFRKAR